MFQPMIERMFSSRFQVTRTAMRALQTRNDGASPDQVRGGI